MDDPLQIMKNAVYEALKAVNENTSPSYPASLFDTKNPPNWPLTVYSVHIQSNVVLQRRDRRVRVTVRVDHFGIKKSALSDIAAQAKAVMMDIIPRCDMDAEGEIEPGKIFRRSQSFSGIWDLQSGTVYS